MEYISNNEYTIFSEYMKNINEFKNKLDDISKKWEQLILFSGLSSAKIDMNSTKSNFDKLSEQLIFNLTEATIKKVAVEMNSKAQVAVDIVIRNLFERTADIGFLATDSEIRNFLTNYNIRNIITNKDEVLKLRKRFEEYVSKYSVYFDIVLFDTQGHILTKLNIENQTTFKSKDSLFDEIENKKCDYLETYKYHDFLPEYEKSLVYSYKVVDEKTNETLGFLSLCFKFTNEMETIFSNLVSKNNKEVLIILDKNCEVIASSDSYHIPLKAKMDIELEKPFGIAQFAGRDYIIKTCKTNGYEGFYGLGWMGHIMIPIDSAFRVENNNFDIKEDVLNSIMQNKNLFKEELISIPLVAQNIQDDLNRAVWNGNIKQATISSHDGDFSRTILREVKLAGEKTKDSFANSIQNLNQTIISSLLNNVSFLSELSIDIMDRNLYERANDCRWWALTPAFIEILKNEYNLSAEDKKKMSEILKYINNLYTVYTNLFIYDKSGTIVAVSNDNYKSTIGTRLDTSWVRNTLKMRDSSRYYVSYFDKTPLYDDKHTFIFNAAINDNEHNLGGIGIVFDCELQFKNMLCDALPSTNGVVNDGYFSMFVEKNYSMVLSCSNDSHYVGEKIDIDNELLNLKRGKSLSKILFYKGKYYLVGASCSKGYREFKSEDDIYQKEVIAFVFVEVGEKVSKKELTDINTHHFIYDDMLLQDSCVEIATFYIGNKWLGVRTSDVIEATTLHNLEKPVSMDATDNHFKGTIIHKKMVLSVLDISKFIQNEIKKKDDADVIIIKYEQNNSDHVIGIVVDKLGEFLKVPEYRIKPFENFVIMGGMLAESIVQPPESSSVSTLLTLLNISKLQEIVK